MGNIKSDEVELLEINKPKIIPSEEEHNKIMDKLFSEFVTDYYLEAIIAKYEIDFNYIVNWDTFLLNLIYNKKHNRTVFNFIKLLEDTNYNFNLKNIEGYSILTLLMRNYPKKYYDIAKIIKISKYDISLECSWVKLLVSEFLFHSHNFYIYIRDRGDMPVIIYNIVCNYDFATYEDDLIMFLRGIYNVSSFKNCSKIYSHIDPKTGNTIIHEMGKRHAKKLLQFVKILFCNPDLFTQKNWEDLTPIDLLTASKI